MTTSVKTRRPSARARRAGYLVGAAIDGVLLTLANAWPGWEAVPFLTAGFQSVIGVVDLALVAGLVTSLLHAWRDPEWLVALDGVVTTSVGLAAAVRLWQVFPFAFTGSAFDWPLIVRIVLVVAIAGTAVALLVQLVALVRAGVRRRG